MSEMTSLRQWLASIITLLLPTEYRGVFPRYLLWC